ncbi:MAG: S26 family signal peptidase, partial [Acidobacteriota bacterium]
MSLELMKSSGRRRANPPPAPSLSPLAAGADLRRHRRRWSTLLLLLLAALALVRSPLRLCLVMSASMEPTLRPGDVAVVLARPSFLAPARRGQVVLASLPPHLVIGSGVPPGRRVLKRVAGVQGDLLEGRGEAGLFRNGTAIPFRSAATSSGIFKILAGRVVQQLEGSSWWHGAPHRAWLEPADDPFL